MPIPKEDSTPRKKKQKTIAVPADTENGLEILDHILDLVREKIGRPVGTPPYFIIVEGFHDYLTD